MTFEDLQIDTFRKDTSVNVSPRGVRIIHKPTGITVVKDEGTQTENKMLALIELAEKVARADERRKTIDEVLEIIQKPDCTYCKETVCSNKPCADEHCELFYIQEIKALSEGKG